MKLLTIGNAPQSNILVNSPYVSGYHADIIILDNGDLLLVDKSTNGTFVKGNKIPQGVEIPIHRGDNVVFADTPLDWNKVPSGNVDPEAKQIYGIGTHSLNRIHITGDKVSRFHATIKQKKDGKWYICDHSTNGTTLDGQRIPKDVFVQLKKGAQIKCAGIPVENPNKSSSSGAVVASVIGGIVAVACVLAAIFIYPWPHKYSDDELYTKYSNTSVMVFFTYHYKISAGSLDIKKVFNTDEFCYDQDGDPIRFNGENSNEGTATGFFISKNGLIATNLHVARPWVVYEEQTHAIEDWFRAELNDEASRIPYLAPYVSQLKVTGVIDGIYVIPTGHYGDGGNLISCSEVVASDNLETDIAVLRIRSGSGKLPEGSGYVDLNNTIKDKDYKQGIHIYTFGYPDGLRRQNIKNKLLEAIGIPGSIMSLNGEKDFSVNANIKGGASGSPVFTNKGEFAGIMSRSDRVGYAEAVRAKYLIKILKDNEIEY